MSISKQARCITMIAVCCTWVALLPQAAHGEGAESLTVPFDAVVEVSTCPDFNTELAHLVGTIHLTVLDATDATGNHHFVVHQSWDGATLTGLTSGTTWHYVTSATSEAQGGLEGTTFESNLTSTVLFVAPGGGNNLEVEVLFHTTIDASGIPRVDIGDLKITCR